MILPHILLVFPLITLQYRIIGGGGGGGLEISPKTNNRGGGGIYSIQKICDFYFCDLLKSLKLIIGGVGIKLGGGGVEKFSKN